MTTIRDPATRAALGARMRELAEQAGGREPFRDLLGVSKQVVFGWLSGRRWPELESQIAIADALGMEDYRLVLPPRESLPIPRLARIEPRK